MSSQSNVVAQRVDVVKRLAKHSDEPIRSLRLNVRQHALEQHQRRQAWIQPGAGFPKEGFGIDAARRGRVWVQGAHIS